MKIGDMVRILKIFKNEYSEHINKIGIIIDISGIIQPYKVELNYNKHIFSLWCEEVELLTYDLPEELFKI